MKVTVAYRSIEAAEINYFRNFYENAEAMLANNNRAGTFEGGDVKYQWELLEKIDDDNSSMYLFSVVKAKKLYPVLIDEHGARSELFIPDKELGDISFGLISPAYKFLICFGSSATSCFKKMLEQFSIEGVVRLNPFFEDGIDEKVMNWDNIKKVSFSMNMPSRDDVTEFGKSKAGGQALLLSSLGGLKLDISVSSGVDKETLSTMKVKDLLPDLLANDLCTSVKVKGSDFESEAMEEYDIKNAPITYSEQLEIDGRYITDTDAKKVLMRALNEHYSYMFRG